MEHTEPGRPEDGVAQQYDTLPDVLKGRIESSEPATAVPSDRAAAIILAQKIKTLQDVNDAEIARLGREGITVQVPGVDMLKFNVLLDILCGPEGSAARLIYDLRVQMTIQAELEKVAGQANRAKLLAPANGQPGTSGLIVPGR